MARKSRKNKNEIKLTNDTIKQYNVGIYVRLSKLDVNDDNYSIENQKNLILNYIKNKDEFKLINIYEDINKTGTNFNRNGFEELLQDLKKGKINCIIVKDLSRFGRNYIECSNYLEKIFPFMNIRFIAINDNYDSINKNSNEILSINLKNIVNELYSKDISKKVSTSLKIKKQKGEFTGSYASYGYLKDPNNKNKIIVNDETADIVRNIFQLRLDGNSYTKIAIILNENNILSPIKYLYSKGIVKNQKFKNSKWNFNSVKTILLNELYIGNMVQGKKKNISINNQKRTSRENWIIVENTHEPIISKEVFYKVQEINNNARNIYEEKNKTPKIITDNIFKNIIKCGECGKRLLRREIRLNNKPNRAVFVCKGRETKQCDFIQFKEEILKEIVFNEIKKQINIYVDLKKLIDSNKNIINLEKNIINNEIKQCENELEKTKSYIKSSYEDYVNNLLSKDDYILIKNNYIQKQNAILEKQKILNEKLSYIDDTIYNKNNFINTFIQFKDESLLTKDLIELLINEIIIYKNRKINITFKYKDEYKYILNRMERILND
mgnify:FL=1